jgi:hypothetical protein
VNPTDQKEVIPAVLRKEEKDPPKEVTLQDVRVVRHQVIHHHPVQAVVVAVLEDQVQAVLVPVALAQADPVQEIAAVEEDNYEFT